MDLNDATNQSASKIESLASQALEIESLHEAAMKRGFTSYKDPETGYQVFTSQALLKRGKCCASGCRHCPFAHENISAKDKVMRIQNPSFLHKRKTDGVDIGIHEDGYSVLFWSGGKDSFLALTSLAQEMCQSGDQAIALNSIVLLTTFDHKSKTNIEQGVGMEMIRRQAEMLNVSLVGVPLSFPPSLDESTPKARQVYKNQVVRAIQVIAETQHGAIRELVFGDLHIEPIRSFRTQLFSPQYQVHFPLFCSTPRSNYDLLLTKLFRLSVSIVLSAINHQVIYDRQPCMITTDDSHVSLDAIQQDPMLQLGVQYTQDWIHSLREKYAWVDAMGENGEFHTCVHNIPPNWMSEDRSKAC